MYFTYGIVFACGCSFAYQPSLVILGHYFKKRLGLVNGIVTAGSSIFTICMPFILTGLLARVGLNNTLRVLCILMFILMLAGFTYKPLLPSKPSNTRTGSRFPPMKQIFNINIWKSLGYRIWAFGIPAALYGYFVPYVHLVSVILPTWVLTPTCISVLFVLLCIMVRLSEPKVSPMTNSSTRMSTEEFHGVISQYPNTMFGCVHRHEGGIRVRGPPGSCTSTDIKTHSSNVSVLHVKSERNRPEELSQNLADTGRWYRVLPPRFTTCQISGGIQEPCCCLR